MTARERLAQVACYALVLALFVLVALPTALLESLSLTAGSPEPSPFASPYAAGESASYSPAQWSTTACHTSTP